MPPILITCCPSDPPTVYGYYYLRKLSQLLAGYDNKIIFLRSANLQNFGKALIRYDPRLVIMNGHGGAKSISGCNQAILAVEGYDPDLGKNLVNENPHWMKDRLVYLFTCNTGKELASRLVENGAIAVAAYKRDFIFVSEDGEPSKDMKAQPSFMAAIQLPIMLAEGYTFKEGCQTVKQAFITFREEAEAQGNEDVAKYLNYNLENFVCYGNLRAKLY